MLLAYIRYDKIIPHNLLKVLTEDFCQHETATFRLHRMFRAIKSARTLSSKNKSCIELFFSLRCLQPPLRLFHRYFLRIIILNLRSTVKIVYNYYRPSIQNTLSLLQLFAFGSPRRVSSQTVCTNVLIRSFSFHFTIFFSPAPRMQKHKSAGEVKGNEAKGKQ